MLDLFVPDNTCWPESFRDHANKLDTVKAAQNAKLMRK